MGNIQKSKHELAVMDELLAHIYNKMDRLFNLGDKFYTRYYGIGILQAVGFYKEEDIEDKYDSSNIWVEVYFPDYNTSEEKYKYKQYSLREFGSYGDYLIIQNPETFEDDVERLAKGESMETLLAEHFHTDTNSGSTGLISMNKDLLSEKRKEMILKQQFAESRMAKVKYVLEKKMDEMKVMVANFKEHVGKLNRLIWSIELYLGIEEELIQFGFGANAPLQPINFRQRLLYMDVEVGDPTDDGLDFTNIDDFDNWLLKFNPYWKKKNYEILIPEERCVTVFRVRHSEKNYQPDNPFINRLMNEENKLTYILIRNGENLYRIHADITIGAKLFPDQDELEKHITNPDRDSEKILERYKLNMILLQGIIERTPCFPDASAVNIFNPETHEGNVNFIYDATLGRQLPTNIPLFRDWRKKLNEQIEEGNRIYYIEKLFNKYCGYQYLKSTTQDRLFKVYYSNEFSIPKAPKNGLYQVFGSKFKDYKGERNVLFIKYNPKGRVTPSWTDRRDWDDMVRKNNLSFEIKKHDEWIINYDAIDRNQLKTLEFYLYTRIGREEYLSYIPMIMELFKAKQEEIKGEDDFIKMCLNEAGLDTENDFETGVQAMEWWKLKNKWKRALSVDDAKAYRMIVKKLIKNDL